MSLVLPGDGQQKGEIMDSLATALDKNRNITLSTCRIVGGTKFASQKC